jgi:hypothetical protein
MHPRTSSLRLAFFAACLAAAWQTIAQVAPQPAQEPVHGSAQPEPGIAAAPLLEPFVATYEAYYRGKPAGNASMQLVHEADDHWRLDLSILGDRGLAGMTRLKVEQSTAFDTPGGVYRPLRQARVRMALLFDQRATGIYDCC